MWRLPLDRTEGAQSFALADSKRDERLPHFPLNLLVEGIPFDGDSVDFLDQLDHVRSCEDLLLVAEVAFVVGDFVFVDEAVGVVGAVPEGLLGDGGGVHDPEALDVLEVVEHEPRDRDSAEVHVSGGGLDVLQFGLLGVEGERGHREEVLGFVLQLAELDEVRDALFEGFDVAIEHRGVLAQAELGGGAGDFFPFIAVELFAEELLVNAVGEYLDSAAGEGIETGFDEVGEGLLDSALSLAGDLGDFDGGECLDVNSGSDFFDGLDEVKVVLVGETGVDSADHVDLGDIDVSVPGEAFAHGVKGHLVWFWSAFLCVERAEFAELVADIGVVDVLVGDEVGLLAVPSLAHDVCHVADGGEIRRLVEAHAVLEAEARSLVDFAVDVDEVLANDSLGCDRHIFSCVQFTAKVSVFFENCCTITLLLISHHRWQTSL